MARVVICRHSREAAEKGTGMARWAHVLVEGEGMVGTVRMVETN